jgi:Flp pilus assembly pilin Flp
VKNRAQSIIEYVIIVSVVAAAVVAMQIYFKRAVNARLEELKQEYVPKVVTP